MTALELLAIGKKFWWVPIIIALVIALLFTRDTLADCRAERIVAEANLKTSNESITRLEKELDRVKAEQQQLSTSDAARAEATRQSLALANAASKVRQGAIDTLLASAQKTQMRSETPDSTDCEFSASAMENWQ